MGKPKERSERRLEAKVDDDAEEDAVLSLLDPNEVEESEPLENGVSPAGFERSLDHQLQAADRSCAERVRSTVTRATVTRSTVPRRTDTDSAAPNAINTPNSCDIANTKLPDEKQRSTTVPYRTTNTSNLSGANLNSATITTQPFTKPDTFDDEVGQPQRRRRRPALRYSPSRGIEENKKRKKEIGRKAPSTKSAGDLSAVRNRRRGKAIFIAATVADEREQPNEVDSYEDAFYEEFKDHRVNPSDETVLLHRLQTGEITVDGLPEDSRWLAEFCVSPSDDCSPLLSSSSSSIASAHTTSSIVNGLRRNPTRAAARRMAQQTSVAIDEASECETDKDDESDPPDNYGVPPEDLEKKYAKRICRDPFYRKALAGDNSRMNGSRRRDLSNLSYARSYEERKKIRYPGRAPWGESDSSLVNSSSSTSTVEEEASRYLAALDDLPVID